MRFNFPFSWYNKFGTIPSTYKEAMSYEEQILWLCKHQDDLEKQFDDFKDDVEALETLVNTFDGRITRNAESIASVSFDVHLLQNSIVQEINSSSTFSDIASAKSVYDFVTSYTPQGVVRTLDDDITLDSSLVLLGTGLYYSGNYEVKTTTGSIFHDETLMIPQNTLFYYDGTHNTFTLLYNEHTPIRDSWLKERWYWFQDTSGNIPDTSAWESKRYRADDNFNFYPSQSEIPTNYALSKVIPKLLQPSTLTTGSYFNIQGIAFEGDVINPPTASSNTAYCFFDISELTSLKFRVTGGCTNYTWFTTDIIPTDNVNQIHIETMSNQNTGYTNEIIEITTNEDSNYVVFNFNNTNSVTPSVENFVIEVDVSTLGGTKKLTGTEVNLWELEDGIYSTSTGMKLKYYTSSTSFVPHSSYQNLTKENEIIIIMNHSTNYSNYIYFSTSALYTGTARPDSISTITLIGYNQIERNTLKVTSLSASSTDSQYPSAKCVYDIVGNVEAVLQTLNSGNGV